MIKIYKIVLDVYEADVSATRRREMIKLMKPKVKHVVYTSNGGQKSLISLWWKMSVSERKAHFQAITVDLLAPYLFEQMIIKDPYCMSWGSEVHGYKYGRDCESDIQSEAIVIMDVFEKAVGTLKENLSKFDSNRYLDKLINSMEIIRNHRPDKKVVAGVTIAPCFKLVLEILDSEEWFNHFRCHLTESVGISSPHRDVALLISSMHVYAYINSLYNGERPLETMNALGSLNDLKILDEKEKGNTFFKKQNYKQAIEIYSKLLKKRPFSHVVYSNRAECYLKTRNFRLALMDARRTITLNPVSEKGHYRYCRALEQIGWYRIASKALRAALKLCTSSVHLQAIQKRVNKRLADRKNLQIASIQELSDEPPDLVSGSSGDESSTASQFELSDDVSSDECGETDEFHVRFNEEISDTTTGVSDSDEEFDVEDQDASTKPPVMFSRNSRTMNMKRPKQASRKPTLKEPRPKKVIDSENNGSLWELKGEMERGTKLYLAGKYDDASVFFNLVINLIKSGKNFSLGRDEEAILIYAYGMCSFMSGSPSDLDSAKVQFNRIIKDFSNVNFPLAYYICAKIYQKQYRFSEMRSSLNSALEIIENSGVVLRKWPGSEFVIKETIPGELEMHLKKLLDSCNNENAYAICRFENCNLKEKHILIKEPDSKGFFRMKCNEFCKMEYHAPCWQKLKHNLNLKDNTPLKGFLNQKCFTPDCSGILTYICFTFLSQDSEVRNIEHTTDPPKKLKNEAKPIDKSKRMKGCSQKKLKKRQMLKVEREEEISSNFDIGDVNTVSSSANEFSRMEALNETANQSNMVHVNRNLEKSVLSNGREPTVQTWMMDTACNSVEVPTQDRGLFVLRDKSSYQSQWQTQKKRKKKAKSKSSNALDHVSPYPQLDPVRIDDHVSSGLEPNAETHSMRDTVTEHLHSLFADLLVSKGHMNVKNDEDVTDLLNILDHFSASIVNSWGGLGNFLAISPTFAFDPDDRDIVYLAEEADIYLLSKREAGPKRTANVNKNSKFYDDWPRPNRDDSRNEFEAWKNTPKKKADGIYGLSSKTHLGLHKHLKGYKEAQQTALWMETENERGVPKDLFQPQSRFDNPLKKMKSKLMFSESLQKAVNHYKIRIHENSGDKEVEGKERLMYDDALQDIKCEVCGNVRKETECFDVAVMTEFDDKHFKELYENEAVERRSLFDKYAETMDNLEQTKNKLRIEKETAASREMELRANLEGTKNKLMKERQWKENMQQNWYKEKESMNREIQSLHEKIKRFNEDSYKAQLKDQQNEINRVIEKIGEMKLREERIRAENEDIISKLSSCVTEQTKRAQNAEVLMINEKKADVSKHFQGILEHCQATIYIIEQSPFLEPSTNRLELLRLWKAYNETVLNNLRKCMKKFDNTMQSVESGVPFGETEPIIVPKNPPAPPQPKIQYSPSAAGLGCHPVPPPATNMSPFMGMFPQRMITPTVNGNGMSLAQANFHSHAKSNPSKTEASATSNRVSVSASSGIQLSGSMALDGEVVEASKAVLSKDTSLNLRTDSKGAVKSSSFEKIMMKLNTQFPQHSREELVKHLKDFREQRNNTLSGLTVDDIITGVSKLLRENFPHEDKNPRETVVKSKLPSMQFGREEPCVICHEDMIHVNKTTQLQCYHVFHTECIQRWLKQQRTCPTCRDHALLPEEFPALH